MQILQTLSIFPISVKERSVPSLIFRRSFYFRHEPFFCATKWLYLLYSLSDKFYYILLLSVLLNKVYFSTCHSSILLLCFANTFSLINSILPLFSIIAFTDKKFLFNFEILGVVKRNPLFLHEIEWKNNGFLFTTPNIYNFFQLIILKFNNS